MIMRNDGKFYEYRTRRRLKETRRLKYNELIDSKRKKTFIDDKSIKDLESELTEYSKKSVNIKTFNEYIKRKINMKRMIRNEKSYNEYLKKLNWYQYINTQRHTDKIVNEIKEFMGDGSTLIVGDWSGKGKISYISTPNVGFQRRLKRDFKVYHINEYNTSKIHHKTKEVMENLQIKTKNGFKKLHSVITFKKGLRGMGCINRDKNAVKNMKIITESLIKTKKRPLEYSRNSNSSTHSQVGLKMRSHSDLKLPQLKTKPKIKSKKKKSVKDFVKVIKIE
jgi:predicted transcriptional regulator YheO